jgi:hypothetical protein
MNQNAFELETKNTEIPSSIWELGTNLALLSEPREVCYIDSDSNTKFQGYCDGILDEPELEVLRTVLRHQVIIEEEVLLPLNITAEIITDEQKPADFLVINCGSTNRWNLQLQIMAGRSVPEVSLTRGKKETKVKYDGRAKLLFSTVAGIMNSGIPQVKYFRDMGIARQKWV